MTTLTLDMIQDFMKELATHTASTPRQFVVQTGIGGMNMIHTAMKESAERESLRLRRQHANAIAGRARSAKKITHIEWQNLRKMIKSPDLENLVLAEAILEQYE